MQELMNIARRVLLDPSELDEQKIEMVMGKILTPKIDMADMYFQNTYYESWVFEDGIVKNGSHTIDSGVGVRVIQGEKTGFAYSDDLILPALESAAMAAATICKSSGSKKIKAWTTPSIKRYYQPLMPENSLTPLEKVDLLKQVDHYARAFDSRVTHVSVSLVGTSDVILIVNSEGQLAADVRPMVRLSVSVIAEEDGKRESGNAGGGGRSDYQYFFLANKAKLFAEQAVQEALVKLKADPAPAGTMPVVLGPGWPGILLHEAVGHGLEGDFNRKGTSAFSGRIGQRVAAPGVTVVDDGTVNGARGSLNIDDEGHPPQCNVLIEDGILKGYMQDKLNARLMGVEPTGNGRRQSYAHLPLPRMTNTYMLAGSHEPAEIIASVQKGLYAVNFGGGQVDITSGKFVFSASEAYLIENGKITKPVKGATLIGNGPDVLTRVSMIGNDLELDPGVGVCGKAGQSVPVGIGQPTLKIDSLTVGGTD